MEFNAFGIGSVGQREAHLQILTGRTSVTTVLLLLTGACLGAPPADSPRVTPTVRLIEKIEPCVVAIYCVEEGGQVKSGSGTIIHPDGFILTNNHVVSKDSGYVLLKDDRPRKFRLAGRLPAKDLAIIRVDAGRKLPTVPFGRSDDTMTGEPVIVAGNPGGRGISFTSGIISSQAFFAGGPSALFMATVPQSRRERFLQFDAATNPGNSGGPLVNMEGELIGVVSGGIPAEENTGFAIPVDRVRSLFEATLAPEVCQGFVAGAEFDPLAGEAVVAGTAKGSPAESCGLRSGDIVTAIDGRPVRHAMDWWMALSGKSASDKLGLTVRRGDQQLAQSLTLADRPFQSGIDVNDPAPGLRYRFFHGQFAQVPDFSQLTPVRDGTVKSVVLKEIAADREAGFGIELSGYLQVPKDGLYRLTLVSDDGSMLYVDGELIIDNDGEHPPHALSAWLRLAKGFHALRIDYFQGKMGKTLELHMEFDGSSQPIGPESLFHSAGAVE